MDQGDILQLGQNKNNQNINSTPIIISSETRQDLFTNQINGNIISRLMSTKIVRFRLNSKCACTKSCRKPFYEVNTVATIDDENPQNENEQPLFLVEEDLGCSCWIFCQPIWFKFEIFDANTKELFSICETKSFPESVSECCGDNYLVYPPIYNYKAGNPNDYSLVNRYDSRSFYRTYEYLEQSYYKIGEPYFPKEVGCCDDCCSCYCQKKADKCSCFCDCGCCETVIVDKRTYIDIYNMNNESVGKFVKFYERTGCGSCANVKWFYEIYFPSDANEMLRLSLIGQMIFFIHFGIAEFGILPYTKDNLSLFLS